MKVEFRFNIGDPVEHMCTRTQGLVHAMHVIEDGSRFVTMVFTLATGSIDYVYSPEAAFRSAGGA